MNKILLLTPFTEHQLKEVCSIVNSINNDFNLKHEIVSLGMVTSLLCRKKNIGKLGFTTVYLLVLKSYNDYKDYFTKDKTMVIGTIDKREKFDVIIGYKKDIITTQEAYLQNTVKENLDQIYTSDDVQIWFEDYGQLTNYLMKGE